MARRYYFGRRHSEIWVLAMASGRENLQAVSAAQGETVFCEGDPGRYAYVIERGRVEISVRRNGRLVPLVVRGPGELFGEMAIVDDKPRSATVTALEDCEFLLITREQLARRIEEADPILRMCLNVILESFRGTMTRLETLGPSTVSTVQTGIGHVDAIREVKLEHELSEAIAKREFEMHYQPIVDLSDGRLAGYESLVRWRHATRGLVSPMVFIPTAEASGLIVQITQLCLEEASSALVRFEALRFAKGVRAGQSPIRDDMFISVNISGRDFADPNFVENLVRTIGQTGADPRRIKLEVTESMLMQNPERAAAALKACRLKGLTIAIDDFGTGYSSLGYLHKFPIDTLKIDRSFVMAMHDDVRSLKIIQSIQLLAKQLRIPVVAEGIETERDAAVLRDLGCEFGQGYLFAKPLPLEQAEELADDWDVRAALPSIAAKTG